MGSFSELEQLTTWNFGERTGFASAWKLDKSRDLSEVTSSLPEGVTIFSTRISAGKKHLKGVLAQAAEGSIRGNLLARNKAIDLLMRLTAQSQIKEAVAISKISSTKTIGAFGFVPEDQDANAIVKQVEGSLGSSILRRDDSLLELNAAKVAYLRKIHSIPAGFPDSLIVEFLLEKSSLLVFSK